MISTQSFRKIKPIIFLVIIAPSLIWSYQLIVGNLGVNPIEKLMDSLGEMALRLIVLTLLISSLSEFKKFRFLIEIRRMIGLFAFFYVSCHFLTYIALDHFFDMNFIIKDIIKRPFITFGFISFVFLIPLAITSPKIILKKIGFKVWKKIHYLIYPAAVLSSVHFYMLVRANKTEPAIYIFLILLLLLYRLYFKIILPQLAR
ncbi:MAG: sulfoxide reductase heme-binding subunit YedZ [Pelagibacteraceae bacterium]|jgi:sulfoxide reductase heme-binding subunit YedZ|nr:sulfoxide reductase heme-binding subunit YedZ [Pelagibacteraceae bacterium]MBT4950829.1 sulfoxide reductase heme-binding subunit YedZ [Pelagibacteraceae bacterium]MBT5213209.1 sulfoxide reductase heme-binding subunit YedZ [Pelagibacteraceae bacterium]